ncbi:Rab family GTPase [Entamoeba marina]
MELSLPKICLVGDSGVGKTSIVDRIAMGVFKNNQQITVGHNYLTRSFIVGNSSHEIAIWDTAGQEKYHSLVSMYLRNAVGALIVFDVTSKASFEDVRFWYDKIKECEVDCVIVLIGNKVDLVDKRIINNEMAKQLAHELSCEYFETSAKSGININTAFEEVITHMQFEEKNSIKISIEEEQHKRCC